MSSTPGFASTSHVPVPQHTVLGLGDREAPAVWAVVAELRALLLVHVGNHLVLRLPSIEVAAPTTEPRRHAVL